MNPQEVTLVSAQAQSESRKLASSTVLNLIFYHWVWHLPGMPWLGNFLFRIVLVVCRYADKCELNRFVLFFFLQPSGGMWLDSRAPWWAISQSLSTSPASSWAACTTPTTSPEPCTRGSLTSTTCHSPSAWTDRCSVVRIWGLWNGFPPNRHICCIYAVDVTVLSILLGP